jgi:hypothetical protein
MICKLITAFALLSVGGRAIDVVVAHYDEDLTWLSALSKNLHIHVYTKGPHLKLHLPDGSETSVRQLPNVGRESHTYLSHIVQNYEHLAEWTVFTQAGEPSFGYKGHRSGGGHLLAGDDFANYLKPHPSGSRFVYTSAVHLPSMNHLLRAAYCIKDELLEGGEATTCPRDASQWTPWWDIGDFRKYISSKVEDQQGEHIMDFYRKYVNPTYSGNEVMAFFPQGARFAVSRDMIQRRPKVDYERLLAVLSNNLDSYAGYYMEWLWSELFLGHQEPCMVPTKVAPISHAEAMDNLAQRFPESLERQRVHARRLSVIGGVSGGISGGVTETTTAANPELSGAMQPALITTAVLAIATMLVI